MEEAKGPNERSEKTWYANIVEALAARVPTTPNMRVINQVARNIRRFHVAIRRMIWWERYRVGYETH